MSMDPVDRATPGRMPWPVVALLLALLLAAIAFVVGPMWPW
jgi:hypothetical protein